MNARRRTSTAGAKLILAAAVVVSVYCQNAGASLLFSEAFNYSSGANLGGNVNPGSTVAWGPASSTTLQIGNTDLTYSGLPDQGGNDLVVTSGVSANADANTYTAVTSGSIYYSFLINCTTLPTANNYVSSLNPGTTGPAGGADALAVYVGASGGGWKIGVRTTGGGTGAVYSGALTTAATYYVVAELTLGSTSVANLYVDPIPGGSQPASPTATQSTATVIASIADVGFKAQSVASAGVFDFDNLLIGTTWGDVAPGIVPEPATVGLMGLGLLGIFFGIRRRATK